MVKNESVAIFGNGNLGICAVHNKTENISGILLKTLSKQYRTGEIYEEDDKPYPIKLIFQNTEGLDVLIRQLSRLREKMIEDINETNKNINILIQRKQLLERHIEHYKKYDCETFICQQLVEEKDAIENVLDELQITTSNYKLLIQDVSILAENLDLPEDATIDEIYSKVKELKRKSAIKANIYNILSKRQQQLEKYIEVGDVARCKVEMLEQEIQDLETLLEDK